MDQEKKETPARDKIRHLEQDLNDLKQGLAVVAEYLHDLEETSPDQEAKEELDKGVIRPRMDEDLEFESIWKFHEDCLVTDPGARIPFPDMYDAFTRYCTRTGRTIMEREAFEFVFPQMTDPGPVADAGVWVGCRLLKG
jgi:hypothetical protein